jgi:signal transduction histidine kinase/DNA-binding response OmpR family regulator
MKNTFLILVLIIFSNVGYSQNKKMDLVISESIRSLKSLKGQKKLQKTLEVTELLMDVDLKRAHYYAQKSLKLSTDQNRAYEKEKSNFLLGKINYHRNGLSNGYLKELERSINWFKKKRYYSDYAVAKVFQGSICYHNKSSDLVSEEMDQLITNVKTSGDNKATAWAYFGRISFRNIHNHWEDDMHYIDSARLYAARIQDKELLGRIRIISALPRIGWPDGRDSCYLTLSEARTAGNQRLILRCYQSLVTSFSSARKKDSTYYYDRKSNELAHQLKDSLEIAENSFRHVQSFHYFHIYDSIITNGKKALPLARQFGWKSRQAFILKKLGHSWLQKGNNSRAINYINRSFVLSKRIGDEYGAYSSGRMLSFLCIQSERYKESDFILKDLMQWIEKKEQSLPNDRIKHILFSQKGQSEHRQKHHESALNYFMLADSIAKDLPSGARMNNDINIMNVLIDLGRVSDAEERYNYIIANIPESFYSKLENFVFVKGKLMLALEKSEEAIEVFTYFLSLPNLLEANERRFQANVHLADLYEQKGLFSMALLHSKKALEIRDKIDKAKDILNLEKLQSQQDLSKKETEIERLEINRLRQKNELDNKNNTLETRSLYIVILFISLFLIAVIFSLVLRRVRDSKEKSELEKAAMAREKRIQELKTEESQRIVELKNQLFANISHEFRTPLTLIKAPVESLIKTANESDAVTLNNIQYNTDQLLVMVDEMLELAELDAGNVSLSVSSIHVGSFLRKIKANFSDFYQQKNIHFSLDIDDEDLAIIADEHRLRIVINNLVKNAIHHTPSGGKVKLSIHANKEGKELSVQLFNRGNQIEEDFLPMIFDRYTRGKKEQYTGYGIGLSLCKEIISLHKGTIEARNIHEGVLFSFTIPTSFVTIKKPGNESSLQEISDELNPIESKDKSILIVEDNYEIQWLLRDILSESYHLTFADNGLHGLEAAKEQQPDLIISDIMMPVMEGIELTKLLKEEFATSHVPIILLTAKSTHLGKMEGLESGADDYLTKPFSPKELTVRVKNLIQKRELLRERFSKNVFLQAEDFTSNSLDREFLTKATDIVRRNLLNADFTVELFCRELALNRNSVHQKLKSLTDLSASKFIRSIKLKKAAEYLLDDRLSMIEISEMAGFNSRQAFNKAFKEQFEMTPSAYRNSHTQN